MISIIYIGITVLLSTMSSQYIFGGDSAEFSAIAHTWSIPHPPGYPLYSLLANSITHLIPFGTIPWRVSLLSVVPTVLTSYILFRILLHLDIKKYIALLASLLYIILFPVWEYALVPEVFALNALFVTSITYLIMLYLKTHSRKYLILSSLLLGMCIAHHHIFVIYIPGWFILLRDEVKRILKSTPTLKRIALTFVLGSSFYLYAPIASYFKPPIQWEDAKTVLGFWRLITRAMYGTFTAYGGSKGNILNQLYDVLSTFIFILQDFRVLGLLFIGIGVWITIKGKKKPFFQFLIITSVIHIFFLFYTNFVLSNSFIIAMYERFLISFYSLLIIYFAIGYDAIYSATLQFIGNNTSKKAILLLSRIILVFVLVIYCGVIAKTNFPAISYIKNGQDFDRLGRDIINSIPSGGIFFPGNDNANFTTMYHIFEEKIPTKAHFFQINFLQQKYYIDQFKKNNKAITFLSSMEKKEDLEKFIKLNKKKGVYLETPMPYGMWMPYGLLWKYYETKSDALADLGVIIKANKHLWETIYHIPELNKNTRNILHLQTIQNFYVEAYIAYAKLLYMGEQVTESERIMRIILQKYRPSSTHMKATLLNLVIMEKKCPEAREVAGDFIHTPADVLQAELLVPMMQYYSVCDPKNAKLPPLIKRVENSKEKSLTPLERF